MEKNCTALHFSKFGTLYFSISRIEILSDWLWEPLLCGSRRHTQVFILGGVLVIGPSKVEASITNKIEEFADV